MMRYKDWLAEITGKPVAKRYKVIGKVSDIKIIKTQKGKPMAFVNLDDSIGKIETVFFPKIWEGKRGHIFKNTILVIEGNKDSHENKTKLLADNVYSPEELPEFQNEVFHKNVKNNR